MFKSFRISQATKAAQCQQYAIDKRMWSKLR